MYLLTTSFSISSSSSSSSYFLLLLGVEGSCSAEEGGEEINPTVGGDTGFNHSVVFCLIG